MIILLVENLKKSLDIIVEYVALLGFLYVNKSDFSEVFVYIIFLYFLKINNLAYVYVSKGEKYE